jgi:hypothetical protein
MTLKQYCDRNNVTINRNAKTGATHLVMPSTAPYPQLWELWRLSDYAVSTVSGPIVWVVSRG